MTNEDPAKDALREHQTLMAECAVVRSLVSEPVGEVPVSIRASMADSGEVVSGK